MAERKLVVQIVGDEKDLLRAFRNSTRASKQFNAQITGATRGISRGLGFASATVGIASVGLALRSTVKAAVDFESAFAGVRKTVDGTEPQLQALARGFREMAREMPVSVLELNRIGEAAGQLGVQREGILEFTRTIAQLAATTNLAADEAATALAQIATITDLPRDKFDELGATVVELGNKLAATESEILDFGLRIAAAGRIIGLSIDETLAIAGAFRSVGVDAEAGGTAVSKVFISLANAVASGGKQLETFAKTAGVSTAEFRQSFERDAAGAFSAFIDGLRRVDKEGGNVFQTIKDLGLSDARLIRAFLSISQSSTGVSRALQIGARAWRENTALTEEFGKRANTAAARMQIFRNRVNDLQIALGDVLIPVLEDIVKPISDWLAITENQEKVQRELTAAVRTAREVFAGIRSVIEPLAGAALKLSQALGGTRKSVQLLLTVVVAAKILAFTGAITGLSTASLIATGRVSALRLALLRLGALGVIAVGIEVILNKDKIDNAIRGPGGLLDDLRLGFLKGGGQLDLPVGINAAQLNKVRNQLAEIKGDGDIVVKALDAAIQKLIEAGRRGDSKLIEAARRSRQAAKARLETAIARGPQGRGQRQQVVRDAAKQAEAEIKEAVEAAKTNFKRLFKQLDLELESALGTSSFSDDIGILRKIEAAMVARIQQEGGTFKRAKELIEVRNRISGAVAGQIEEAKQKAQEAFSNLLDGLNLNLERAQATAGFKDDLTALNVIEKAIRDRIQVEGRTTDLLRQLFQVQQDRTDVNRQIREQAAEQRSQAAERLKGRQFETLGLTAEGAQRTAGVGALRRRLASLREQVKGTVLDTAKTRAQLANIGKVLSQDFRKVGKEVRAAIQQMFKDINDALDEPGGKVTAHRITDPRKITEDLGLTPEQLRALNARLISRSASGSFRTTAGQGAFGFPTGATTGGAGIVINGPITVVADDPDAFMRELGKRGRRAVKSRGGRFAGNRGL